MVRFVALLGIALLAACQSSVPEPAVLTPIEELDSLRLHFGTVTVQSELLGQYVVVSIPDGRTGAPEVSLGSAITALYDSTLGASH
jgi:hypothetical protein